MSKQKKGQRDGWEIEIMEWFSRANFKSVWDEHGDYFDKSFFEYFNKK